MNLRACLRLAALLAAALSSACANTAVHRPVADDMRSKIQNSEEVIGIKQDALYATYIPSMMSAASARTCSVIPGLGGLLAGACAAAMEGPDAVINASRAKDAAAAVAPLKDALADYSFDAQLRAELASSLSRNSAVHPVPEAISVTRQVSDADYEKTLRACHASALMFTTVDYHLSPDFSTLTVSSQSLIYPCSAKLRAAAGQPDLAALPADFQPLDVANAIYRNMIAYEARLPDASTASADNIARWHSGDAALLKAVLNQAAHELATQLSADIERTPAQAANDAADANAGTQILVPSPIGQGFSVLQASVVAQSDSGKLLRFKDGTLKYIGNLAMLATPSPAVSAAANSDPAAVAAPPLAEPVH